MYLFRFIFHFFVVWEEAFRRFLFLSCRFNFKWNDIVPFHLKETFLVNPTGTRCDGMIGSKRQRTNSNCIPFVRLNAKCYFCHFLGSSESPRVITSSRWFQANNDHIHFNKKDIWVKREINQTNSHSSLKLF